MEFLYSESIYNYYLKPENILIKEDKIKLVGYGINFISYNSINNYMAPELLNNYIENIT